LSRFRVAACRIDVMVRLRKNAKGGSKIDSLSIPVRSNAAHKLLSLVVPERQGLQMLFAGFIDLYCESIPELRRAHVKNELRSILVGKGIVPELVFSDDLSHMRVYSSTIISTMVRSVLMGGDPRESTSRPIAGRAYDIFNQSRFRTEFEEIETIGRGGFGEVYRVRSLLDKHEYAIKKIVARDEAELFSQMILHEVQVLAGLQHVNIVRYHCGWVEMENRPGTSSPSFTPRTHPRTRKDSSRINILEIFDSCDFSSDESASPSVQVEEIGEGEEETGMDSIATMSSASRKITENSPVGGRFWNNAETSSDSIEAESVASNSNAGVIPVQKTNGRDNSVSSMGSGVVQKSPVGGRFWKEETSSESLEDESTAQQSSVLATAIPVGEKRKRGGGGDGEWSEEKAEERKVSIVQVKLCMAIYIQMELCTTTLEKFMWKRNEQLIRQSIPVDGQECLSLFRQLISALEYIHEKGLIHRDVKPGNLFLKMDRHSSINLLLGDFGLSCLDGEEKRGETGDNMIVPSGAHSIGVGTTTYAAPEQMRTSRYGREVDLFSSGIVLLELFSIVGTVSERLAVIERLREARELPPQLLLKWPSICSLVLRLTSTDPAERPSATAVLNELKEEASEKVGDRCPSNGSEETQSCSEQEEEQNKNIRVSFVHVREEEEEAEKPRLNLSWH
ncbi:hypothetical protein PMAYCL1PPCAC_02172, partial [Pristionchus mayeri]